QPSSANWSDSANWSGGAPSAAETDVALVFPEADIGITPQQDNINDIVGLNLSSIQFVGGGYTLSGNSVTMAGNTVISDSRSTAVFEDNIEFTIDQQALFVGPRAFFDHIFDVAEGGYLHVTGQITGAPVLNSVHKTGAGGPILDNSTNDYGGSTEIDAGVVIAGANAVSPHACTVAAGAFFQGSG